MGKEGGAQVMIPAIDKMIREFERDVLYFEEHGYYPPRTVEPKVKVSTRREKRRTRKAARK